jgi:hypothetical protein
MRVKVLTAHSSALNRELVHAPEASANYQTAWCNFPQDSAVKISNIQIYELTLTGDLSGTNHFHKTEKTRNHPHQNVLITLTKVKTLTSNKLLILVYKTILKPIWTYGIQLWGTASTFKIEILERFQSKALRMIVVCAEYFSS